MNTIFIGIVVFLCVLEAASFLGVDRKTIWEHATKRKTLPTVPGVVRALYSASLAF